MLSKKDFPLLVKNKNLVYLDSAATTQKPEMVLDSILDWYTTFNANTDRGLYDLSIQASNTFQQARESIADLFGVMPNETIFIKNATEGFNLLANGLLRQLKPGQNIVISGLEHHSNYLPWLNLSKRLKLELRIIPIKDHRINMKIAAKLIDSDTAILSASHASNVLGYLNPIKELASLAHRNNALVIVDGTQVVPHQKVYPWEIGADAYIFSGHKAYGPNGSGVIFLKESIAYKIDPLLLGGDMVESVNDNVVRYKESPYKFEGGTQNPAAQVGLSVALSELCKRRPEVIKHEQELIKQLEEKLTNPKVIIHNPNPDLPILTFSLKALHCHDVASLLNEQQIAVRAGFLCAEPLVRQLNEQGVVRVSLGLYNTESDIDKLVQVLNEICERV